MEAPQRVMRRLEHNGRTLSVSEWVAQPEQRALGLSVHTINQRLRDSWPVGEALTTQRGARRNTSSFRVATVPPESSYLEDAVAQAFVAEHGGATLDEVAKEMGITRERVRQIEAVALARLRKRMPLAGITVEDLGHVSTGRYDGPPVVARAPGASEPVEHDDGRPWSPALRELDEQLERATRRLEAWLDVLGTVEAAA
jgi:hypothetical protein